MRHLRWISYLLTAGGIVLALVGAAGLGAGVVLTGILLAFAGIVKIAVVAIWAQVAGLDNQDSDQLGDSTRPLL